MNVRSDGAQASGAAQHYPAISDDGRFVAFQSASPDLVRGYVPKRTAVYLHDRRTGRTSAVHPRRPGMRSSGSPAISADGRRVAFVTLRPRTGSVGGAAVMVLDRVTRRVQRVDVSTSGRGADADPVSPPVISGNGRFVAFSSSASNLVRGDRNGGEDAFVRDLRRGRTRLLSVRRDGAPLRRCQRDTSVGERPEILPCGTNPVISRNGRFAAFGAFTRSPDPVLPGLPGIYWRDLRSGDAMTVGTGSVVPSNPSAISPDGRVLAFNRHAGPGPAPGLFAHRAGPSTRGHPSRSASPMMMPSGPRTKQSR